MRDRYCCQVAWTISLVLATCQRGVSIEAPQESAQETKAAPQSRVDGEHRDQSAQPRVRVENVSFENAGDNVTLVGTLSLPLSTEPVPAVILSSALGPPKVRMFVANRLALQSLATELTKRGIAVLHFDDRGVGKSTGDPALATIDDLAKDLKAGLAFLKGRSEIDTKRIGLVGHSDAGLAAPMVAADCREVACVVLISTPGTTGSEMVVRQISRDARKSGASDESVELVRKSVSTLLDSMRTAELTAKLELTPANVLPANADDRVTKLVSDTAIILQTVDSAWLRHFLTLDPPSLLQNVPCPLLAVYGGDDAHYPGNANIKATKRALKANELEGQHVVELPGLNHNLQRITEDTLATKLKTPMDPSALEVIADWIQSQLSMIGDQ